MMIVNCKGRYFNNKIVLVIALKTGNYDDYSYINNKMMIVITLMIIIYMMVGCREIHEMKKKT